MTTGSPALDRVDWYREAVVYQLHVRAFRDSDGDGTGDFDGLTERLEYIRDLGATAIWLLPFYPSPMRDDGYDIADERGINPVYGDFAAFRRLLRRAHGLGLRVITELVLNHTSDQHPWFQRARRSPPGSPERDFYVWSDDPNRYSDARVIFSDFEASNWTWDPVAGAYYWHRFYSHQPDLNFESPQVHRAVLRAVEFWLRAGMDGLRLDAVPYLYEREGTSCENLPETHEFLRKLRRHVDERFSDRMLLAEANQWPEDAVAYFGDGDECHMAFHFPLMPRLFMALRSEDRYPIVDILDQTPQVPDRAQWAIFLRNHDELTLEMVTDEERDYMYRTYAHDPEMRVNLGIRRRLAPLLQNDRRKIELLNALLFSLPGTPIIYYGDEIGMGDNVYLGDRDGVRTPMQWSSARNGGFSEANPQRLYLPVIIDPEYHHEKINVENQEEEPHSLLRWMRQMIAVRKRHRAFALGSLRILHPDNPKVVTFVRELGEERVLVVANLSRFSQYAELDLDDYVGLHPVELFGRTEFPPIGHLPYLFTLAPYSMHWFALEPRRTEAPVATTAGGWDPPLVTVSRDWSELFRDRPGEAIQQALPHYLRERRWFGARTSSIESVSITETVRITRRGTPSFLVIVAVHFLDREPAEYVLPLAVVGGERADELLRDLSHGVVARVRRRRDDTASVLSEALWEPDVCRALLDQLARRTTWRGDVGEVTATSTRALRREQPAREPGTHRVLRGEQSNSSVVFDDRLILKLFRRLEDGPNPDLEVARFLERTGGFDAIPALAGALEYRRSRRAEPSTLAILHTYVPNEGDAWTHALDELGRFYERTLAEAPTDLGPADHGQHLLDLAFVEPPEPVAELVGIALPEARVLGTRTAQLHRALATPSGDPAFDPDPMSPFGRRSMYQSMVTTARRALRLLRRSQSSLPDDRARALAARVLRLEPELVARFETVQAEAIRADRIRIHGDYHLGQVLFTGNDFVILDFEGEPLRPIGQRRLKRPALRDVAGMVRSFHYATYSALDSALERGITPEPAVEHVEAWGRVWFRWVTAAFLGAYLEEIGHLSIVPDDDEGRKRLFDALIVEKAMYEITYELENRPEWVSVPLSGLLQHLDLETVRAGAGGDR